MYVAIRRYKGDRSMYDDLKEKIETYFLPDVMRVPGFSGYYAVDCGGENLATVTIFETQEGEQKSTALAAEFVKKYYPNKVERISVDEGNCVVEKHALTV